MEITYKNAITAEEVNSIRKFMGWMQIHPEQQKANIDGYAFLVSAYDGEAAIGIAGLRWSGGNAANINIMLVPEYKNQGIEQEFITRIFDFLRSKLKPGFGIQIEIYVQSGQEKMYEDLGFRYITPENSGIAMKICLTNQIELTDKMFKQMGYEEG